MSYDHNKIEKKWQDAWEKSDLYRAEDFSTKPKFYCLDMFPYPSAEGLHVGHPEGYTATDIYSRYLRAKGYNVLHPMGWDAFGLPTENYAIKTKQHPWDITVKNTAHFREQLKSLGFSYDWSREINTTFSDYYKWTQWIFLQLFKRGLAYEATVPINWCPSCKTGLANEEVVDGKCDRCHTPVERKNMKQWLLKITAYADRLLKDIDLLDWPERIKEMQRNWIGKSEGYNLSFSIKGSQKKIGAYTTRIDTLSGVAFIALAPEHPLLKELVMPSQKEEIRLFMDAAQKLSDRERERIEHHRAGAFTGSYAINPVNGQEIPIWAANYVLMSYGSGAVMGVPSCDERDWDFAQMYKERIKIKPVVIPRNIEDTSAKHRMTVDGERLTIGGTLVGWGENRSDESLFEEYKTDVRDEKRCHVGEGVLINSDEFNGLDNEDAKEKIAKKIKARQAINYKMRDWIFSRQRYWGEPIPVIHCGNCGVVPVPEKDLPVLLPVVKKYEPTGTGESPLAAIEDWVNVECPQCSNPARRETNTMPQWAGSCWYYLRYLDPHNDQEIFDKAKMQYWCPVDLYVGGAEHAVLHLLYARFWHKVLYDAGYVDHPEPFIKLLNQGLILGEDGVKMSKSRGNVINPDEVVAKYGADTLRIYEMFMGPFADAKPWDTKGIIGVYRFLERVNEVTASIIKNKNKFKNVSGKSEAIHKTIKEITADIEGFKFNTAVSKLMIFFNGVNSKPDWRGKYFGKDKWENWQLDLQALESFIQLLAPFAPHLGEELWEKLGHKQSIFTETWPEYDEEIVKSAKVQLVVQINGKVRDKLEVDADITKEVALKLTRESAKVKKWTGGKKIVKEIYVPGRLVNIVLH